NMRTMYWLGNNELLTEFGQGTIPATLGLDEAVAPARLTGGNADPSGMPQHAIRFENVSFAYPGTDRAIFSGLDLDITHGESLAVVGANGAGKTTIVKLLCRLYDPDAGRITVDGTDIREFPPHLWQRRVGAIFQDFVHYPFSARTNIAFGDIGRIDDESAVRRAAELGGATGIVEGLTKGWDTILSRQFEDGADLSGGEWQRVALARAMMAASGDIGVLVLDEPTANLDVRGEAEIYGRFLELTHGKTTIVISHRFSTVRRADRICVLEDGRVVEQGSHERLLSNKGRYAEMFRLQAARFLEEGVSG
ncbi:MAG: ABC transporter ATP-binding protein, partial [Actinomycetota bacterium]